MIGSYCIIRCTQAGVHAGILKSHTGTEVVLKQARRLWRWHAKEGVALSGVAVHGLSTDDQSKIDSQVEAVWLADACEIIPCSTEAESSIRNA